MLFAFHFLLLLTRVACSSLEADQPKTELFFENIHAHNLTYLNLNDEDLDGKVIDMVGKFGSALATLLDDRILTLEHTRDGFVGVFRPEKLLHLNYQIVTMLYPFWDQHQVNRLPSSSAGIINTDSLAVRENDIVFMVLPHQKDWPMDLKYLKNSLQVACQSSEAFKIWAGCLHQLISNANATIVVARIGKKARSYRMTRGGRSRNSMFTDFPLLYDQSVQFFEESRNQPLCKRRRLDH